MLLTPLIDYEDEVANLASWFLRRSPVKIDNFIFFLHYNVTVTLLISASVLVTAGLYIGDPIDCISDSSVQDVIDSFCWVQSTYTVPKKWNDIEGSKDLIAHPGVQSSARSNTKLKFHGYYQWVSSVLVIQAMVFCISKCLWENWEGGRIKLLKSYAEDILKEDLNVTSTGTGISSEAENNFLRYFMHNLGKQNFYFRKLVICETLNLLVAISQFLITNAFLGGELTNASWNEVIRIMTVNDPLNRDDLVAEIFPKVTKCTFNVHGPSGDIQNHDALCILPFNVINEKIYLVFGLWLVILIFLSSLVLLYRSFLLVPVFRISLLKRRTKEGEIQSFNSLKIKLKIGDWFLLHQLSGNMDYIQFTEVVKLLENEIREN